MSQVANGGPYLLQYSEKLKVKKAGKDTDSFIVSIDFTASRLITGSFVLSDGVNHITGTCILQKGKKLFCTLDSAGRATLALAVGAWIELLANQQGVFFLGGWTIYYYIPITFKAKVDKNTGRPMKKSKLKLKGSIEGDTTLGPGMSRKYNYQAKMEFL